MDDQLLQFGTVGWRPLLVALLPVLCAAGYSSHDQTTHSSVTDAQTRAGH
ncbi:MAG: hypothetical protein IPQ21_08590 [Betaproteobacteria bacterium]|nr:hypothetical protein [Betaproteobacteria bacterium]